MPDGPGGRLFLLFLKISMACENIIPPSLVITWMRSILPVPDFLLPARAGIHGFQRHGPGY